MYSLTASFENYCTVGLRYPEFILKSSDAWELDMSNAFSYLPFLSGLTWGYREIAAETLSYCVSYRLSLQPFQVSDLRRSTSVIWAVTARQPARVVNPTSGATQLPASSWTSFHWASCKIWIQTGSHGKHFVSYIISCDFTVFDSEEHLLCSREKTLAFHLPVPGVHFVCLDSLKDNLACNIVQYRAILLEFATVTWPQLTLLLLPLLNHWLTFAVSALLKAKGWWP